MEAQAISKVVPVIAYRKLVAKATCTCNAYAFPHRAGGGACKDPGHKPSSCSECSRGKMVRDPYGTGDRWYSISTCEGCLWD